VKFLILLAFCNDDNLIMLYAPLVNSMADYCLLNYTDYVVIQKPSLVY